MPVVLISRGTMSGAQLLVDCLRDRIGYRCLAREDLLPVVNEYGDLANRIVHTLPEATRAYDRFSELRRPYVILMRRALLEYAQYDNLVYHGYSGHLLVPPIHHFLRMRIHGSLNQRVQLTRERLHCDEAKAREYILEEDEKRVSWARFVYGRDIREPALYDLCVSLERLNLDVICRLIQQLTGDPDLQATPESTAEVDRMLVSARVEAALVTDPRTLKLEISAEVNKDGLELLGPYLEGDQLEAVLELARKASGVTEVKYTPGYAPIMGFTPWSGPPGV